jgi:hypothetical protein
MAWFITFGGEDRRRNGKRKTCWVPWEQMKQPKSNGELGFHDIEIFNLALLAWQAKRILQNLDTLSALFFKAVYFLEGDFFGGTNWITSLQYLEIRHRWARQFETRSYMMGWYRKNNTCTE